jgi:hypothetical protein
MALQAEAMDQGARVLHSIRIEIRIEQAAKR